MTTRPDITPPKTRNTENYLTHDEARAQAEALFMSLGDGAIATDAFGRITRVNATAASLLGFKESELVGKWFPRKVIAVNEQGTPINMIDRAITRAFLTGQPIYEKTYYKKKDGRIFPVSLTVSPIMLHDKPIGAVEVFHDITLEQEVDRMKSEFISLASHQLRTPLSAIKTYSHMLVEGYMGELTAPQKQSLQTIIGASDRMNELIDMLLNVSRIEGGSVMVNPKPVNLRQLAAGIVKDFEHAAAERNINLTLNADIQRNYKIKTDSLLTKEILSNLISNALKYTPENGSVTIGLTEKSREIIMSVSDTGLGIPKYSQDQIFMKFFRASNVIKRETSGTGLGLYLVKELVDRLDGRIWFESEEDKGTTFYVTLPKNAPRTASKGHQMVRKQRSPKNRKAT